MIGRDHQACIRPYFTVATTLIASGVADAAAFTDPVQRLQEITVKGEALDQERGSFRNLDSK